MRRSFWTASGPPKFVGEGCDVIVPECGDAMLGGSRLSLLMGFLRVWEGLPRLFGPRQVVLFSVLLGNTVGMRGDVV